MSRHREENFGCHTRVKNIYQRKDGRWEGRYIRGRKENGGALYGYVYGKSYGDCRKKRLSAIASVPQHMSECKLTAKELFDAFLADRTPHVKPSTIYHYSYVIQRYFRPAFGSQRVDRLTAKKLQTFLCGLRVGEKPLSAKSVHDIGILLRSALRFGVRELGVDKAVTDFQIPASSAPHIDVFSEQELQKLALFCINHPSPLNVGILLALNTGLRLGEICALRWSDLDFANRTLKINRTVQRVNMGGKTALTVGEPKTERSKRTVTVPADMMKLLTAMYERSAKHGYIFGARPDCPLEPRTCQRHFKSVLKSCGLKDRNFHVTRHTFATRCVEKGGDVRTLSELLGHANIQTTLRLYVHPSEEHKRQLVEQISFLPTSA